MFLGQQINDHNPVWLLEFWNHSINKVWSLDGTASVPSLSPNLGAPDGRLSPDPGVNWVVTGNGVEVVGERVGEPRGNMTLFHVTPPVRFRYGWDGDKLTLRFPDGLAPGQRIALVYGAGDELAGVDTYAETGERLWFGVDGDGDGVLTYLGDSPRVIAILFIVVALVMSPSSSAQLKRLDFTLSNKATR